MPERGSREKGKDPPDKIQFSKTGQTNNIPQTSRKRGKGKQNGDTSPTGSTPP